MRKTNRNIKYLFLKGFLLSLFLFYTCSITFFMHTHIIGGVTIVHSHWYSADTEGNPTHEHTSAEIQLIQFLSTYFSLSNVLFAVIIGITAAVVAPLLSRLVYSFKKELFTSHLRLRAPPVL